MSWVWVTSGVFYWFRYERKNSNPNQLPTLSSFPRIALIAPFYNESPSAEETLRNLLDQNYPNFEVIAVNDCSMDLTGEILNRLAREHSNLRVIHNAENQGKAVSLTAAALLTDAEFLLCIDGDSLLDHNAARWMLSQFLTSSRVGAVTGNPRIRTRSSVLGKIQVGEFSSIIGLIKRAQRTYGRLFTVSGVCVMFRKSALEDVGFWSSETLTEDIDISWKLQIRHWEVRFEPAATCWILMPETIKGLWSQRLRWATGGAQAILKFSDMWFDWKSRRMWPIFFEYILSLLWSYAMLATILIYCLHFFFALPDFINVQSLTPQWTGVLVAVTSMTQIAVAMFIDSRYDYQIWRNYFFTIWYPIAFWILCMATTVVAFPRALLRSGSKRGRWNSPDRGLQ
ncbi:poly-beta-1,6-N-acetyl-D-glucosamine synthase [Polynucleobacter arcticus]|uniref:Poly-beta-1,6-N-acetyl-D-glucosamine synthase n=2 Tax=Polynucleobacter arcticus TaxID=1743165 RepID=A0A6M9PHK5_9BURK|nr:poly-beta-1,6-N-acetyl-D-glucosamine synthase [Polynucleobacter arcticus]QKM59889.1 poly-beta-1,6 N-acetyl-D-glucosamine synthase [Polynucleobacter arcticus]